MKVIAKKFMFEEENHANYETGEEFEVSVIRAEELEKAGMIERKDKEKKPATKKKDASGENEE